jgi:hypothetical protein
MVRRSISASRSFAKSAAIGQVAFDLFKRSWLHRKALAVEVAKEFVTESLGEEWLHERIITAYGKPEEALGFIACGVGCPGRAMSANAAHTLHAILAKAQIVISAVFLATDAKALHNRIGGVISWRKSGDGLHCDLCNSHPQPPSVALQTHPQCLGS